MEHKLGNASEEGEGHAEGDHMGKLLRGREGGRVDGDAQNRHHEEWPASGSCAQVRRQITDALYVSRVGGVPTSAGMEMRIERTAIAIAPLEFSVSAEAGTLPFSTSGRRAAPSCQTRSVSLARSGARDDVHEPRPPRALLRYCNPRRARSWERASACGPPWTGGAQAPAERTFYQHAQ